ncbi:MAG TPA: DUF721 domain-containing protein [Nitrospiria bacterium]|nr:DUF721 domain-containing protein [Nitrospiria bacterium]
MAYPLPVATLLKDILRKYGLEPQIRFFQLIDRWEEVVGSQVAGHTLPASLKFRKLTLHVDSSAWMNQLNYLKEELIGKINRELGENWVKEVYLKIGPVEKSGVRPEEPKEEERGEATLSKEDKALIEKWSTEIKDAELREKLRHLMEADLRRQKKQVR